MEKEKIRIKILRSLKNHNIPIIIIIVIYPIFNIVIENIFVYNIIISILTSILCINFTLLFAENYFLYKNSNISPNKILSIDIDCYIVIKSAIIILLFYGSLFMISELLYLLSSEINNFFYLK